MASCTRLLVACALALALLPAAHAQTRQSSGAWSVLCSGGATGYCSASSRIKAAGGSPYRFQVNVSRGAPGADFEIALLAPRDYPGEGASISVQVDSRRATMLAPEQGYRRAGRSRTYVVAGSETENLLAQMRHGERVVFRYQDTKGSRVAAAFSLTGLSKALAFMDRMQPAPRSSPKAAAAPPERPAPVENITPVPPMAVTSTPSASTAAPAPAAQAVEATPAPVRAPAQTAATAPAPARVPAQTAATAPAPASVPAQTAAATPTPPPAPAQAVPSQPTPSPAQRAATAPTRKPSTAQKQAAVTAAPSASRKRGARSIRQFSCRGNEPFWNFVIDNDSARYSAPAQGELPDAVELKGKLRVTGDGPTPIVDWRGKSDWGGIFRAVVSEQACRDSMSDSEGQTEFEYRARLTLPGGKSVEGCCNAGLPPVAVEAAAATEVTQYPVADVRSRPETDWSHHLFELLPAIQACIDKTPEPYPYATKAWPMNRGMVGVRTRNRGGGWFECVAESNGRSVDRFVPLPSTAPPAPNEDRVVFSPPDQSPPAGNCFQHERVMDGIGDFMGWLSTNGCS
jgi:uncharacterized membrane protein/invasion protein IalB